MAAIAAAAVTLSATHAAAAEFLVTPAWLASRLHQPGIVILHVGERADYEKAHIPGAQFVDRSELSDRSSPLTLQMAPLDTLRAAFETHGVGDESRIILYFGTDWVSPTARVYVTLDYLGLGDRTSILDGGLPAWRAAGQPVTTNVPTIARGRITAAPRPDAIAGVDWVRAHMTDAHVRIIDARTPEFYSGEKPGMFPRPGHIPGAVNLPFNSLNEDPSNALKNERALRAAFEAVGVKPGDEVVTYCHIGQQASHVYFVAKMLGYRVHLYDGSFEEWSKRDDLPVAKGAKP